jgi:hypothetical protein
VTGAGVSASSDTGLFLIQLIGGDLLAKTEIGKEIGNTNGLFG